MSEKPDIVKQYERRKEAGESLYFDPVELEDMFHYYAEEGSMEHEEEILRLAQTLHPDDIVTHTLAAEWALSLEDAEGCLRELEALSAGGEMDNGKWTMDNGEESVMYCILKSGALALKGDVTGAIEYGEKALEGDDPLIAYDVGLGFMNANQPTIALRYFDRCLEAFPNDLTRQSQALSSPQDAARGRSQT